MVRFEHLFMIFWHALVNLLHCLPIFYTGTIICRRHGELTLMGLAGTPTADETAAYNNAVVLMAAVPCLFLVVVPALEWGALMLYYSYGHPWCKLYNAFTPQVKKPLVHVSNEKHSCRSFLQDSSTIGEMMLRDPSGIPRRTKDPLYYRSALLENPQS